MFKWDTKVQHDTIRGYTLVLPSVSVGNVGQLAIDVLLENLKPLSKKIGRIFHPALEPVIGTDIAWDGTTDVTTPCEIYRQDETRIIIIQFHSPVLSKGRQDFIDFLVDWIKEQNFEQVICLSSTFASERIDSQLVGLPFRYLATDNVSDALKGRLNSAIQYQKLESRQFPAPAAGTNDDVTRNDVAYIPGGGFTKHLFEACVARSIPFVVLIKFASDGCSLPEVVEYFKFANDLLHLAGTGKSENRILTPYYWINGQHLEAPPTGIF